MLGSHIGSIFRVGFTIELGGLAMWKNVLLAALVSCMTEIVVAQEPSYPVERSSSEQYGPGPHLFLACGRGAWSLNGNSGVVLHEHSGIVEHWALVKDREDCNFYYYHEHSLTGPTDFPCFQWAFCRHHDPCNPCLRVYRRYPHENWTYVCCACFSKVSSYSTESTNDRRANATSSP